jgi:cytochrome c-type biogenesis protein CcmH
MKWTRAIVFVLSTVTLVPSSWGRVDPTALESEAKQIETLLIAPCCWRQPISDHQSEIATEMKAEIRRMLEEGKSRQDILDSYVNQYGARILSIPPQQGFNRMSFLMPMFFAVLGLAVVGGLLRKWRRQPTERASSGTDESKLPSSNVSDDVARRIQKELDEMD